MLSDYLSRKMCLFLEAGGKITDTIVNNGICHADLELCIKDNLYWSNFVLKTTWRNH